jgi:hypothetical protein
MYLRPFFPKFLSATAIALIVAGASAQVASQVQTQAHPTVRITAAIDGSVTAPLAGTHPPVVDQAVIGSRLPSSRPLQHMTLVLSSTDEQERALRTLLDQQQDKTSPNFHKWLTPDAFGQSFGVAASDVAAITTWLQAQGFTVDSVAKGQRVITFSGNVGQVETAFHTQMNSLTVNGEAHFSNTTDLAVPQAFAGVVRGIASLNDFQATANIVNPHKAELPKMAGAGGSGISPLYTSTSSGSHYVTPGDAETIFNGTPLLAAGIDGTGVKIGVIGRTDITLSDVQQFRSMFGLKKNDPTFTVVGEDPGITTDDLEAYLDVEWAGGMAPGANVNFVVAGSNYVGNAGIYASGLYLVDNNLTDIITMSYGGCEASNAAAGTASWNTLWEQAAAQGQSVFVSSGDSNATGCQSSSATYGTAYGVNALGSSAFNVAVGGSMFVDYGPSQYWGTGVAAPAPAGYNFATATGYVPEAVWNEGALSKTYLNTLSTAAVTGTGIVGGGGGISIFTPRPSWQVGSGINTTADPTNCTTQLSGVCYGTGTTGAISSGLRRLVPDIVFIAASGHDGTAFCGEGSCSDTSTGYGIGVIGGTSVATPVMASVQALINQKNGGRQGNPNFHYYPLANQDYLSGVCKSANGTAASPTVTLPASTCNFHDIVTGGNNSPKASGDSVGVGFLAATGFDEGSGLGSVNIANVANNWNNVSLYATTTTFTLTPLSTTHGTAQTFTAAVTSTGGTPTGDISIIAATTNPGTVQYYTLSSGAYSGSINGLPGGTYNVTVHYEGDGSFGPSDSAPQQVTIAKEPSTVTNTVDYFIPGSIYSSVTTMSYGAILDFITKTAGTSGTGIPTGTMTFGITNTGTSAVLPSETITLDASANASLISGGTYTGLLVAANYPSLPVGTYSITANYSGDNSFNASSATNGLTVVRQTPTGTMTLSSSYIASGAPVTLNYTVARQGGTTIATLAAYPSGTITFNDTTSGAVLGMATLNSVGLATLTTTGITNTGANTINAVYSGDTNYAPLATATTATVTVGAYTATTTSLTVATGTYYVGSTVALTATVSPAVSASVKFYSGSTYLGAATANGSTGIATLSTTALTAGSLNLSATFAGTSTYTSSTGTTTLTVNQNVTTTTVETNATGTTGQSVAIAGRIVRSPTGSTVPTVALTGTLTFFDGTTVLGTATPVFTVGGYAYYLGTLTVTSMARGTHTLTASYSGDSNYAASSSSAITLTIGPNNVWTASSTGSVNAITGSGTSLANGTGGGIGVAIDGAGDVWSINLGVSSVAEFSSTGGMLSSSYSGAGITTPSALAIDGSGMVWLANSNSTVSVLSSAGTAVSTSSGYPTTTATPSSLSIDGSGNLWITNAGDNSLTEVIGAAAPVATPIVQAVTNNTLATKP